MAAIIRSFALLIALVFFGSLLANSADAQVGRTITRHFGVGYGNGYHVKTPLSDSSYYHPYSTTNSTYLGPYSPQHFGTAEAGVSFYSGFQSAQGYSVGSYYPGAHVDRSFINRPLPKWHGHTRSNIFGR